jgi:hypothetical protein
VGNFVNVATVNGDGVHRFSTGAVLPFSTGAAPDRSRARGQNGGAGSTGPTRWRPTVGSFTGPAGPMIGGTPGVLTGAENLAPSQVAIVFSFM